jgi:hypothetical protein
MLRSFHTSAAAPQPLHPPTHRPRPHPMVHPAQMVQPCTMGATLATTCQYASYSTTFRPHGATFANAPAPRAIQRPNPLCAHRHRPHPMVHASPIVHRCTMGATLITTCQYATYSTPFRPHGATFAIAPPAPPRPSSNPLRHFGMRHSAFPCLGPPLRRRYIGPHQLSKNARGLFAEHLCTPSSPPFDVLLSSLPSALPC